MTYPRSTRAPRGFVLILVLVVIMILSLGAYAFSELMLSHYEASTLSGKQIQARMIVDSGVDSARMFLAQDKLSQADSGGTYNNPDMFQGVLVVDDLNPAQRGRFTLLASSIDDEGNLGGVRYGLENESTRLNLNALLMIDKQQVGGGRQLLMSLPGCTQEIADAILDFIDEDSEPREFGCEADYYSSLTPPYAPKNGQLDTVEELLLVRGVTPDLLFGLDVNRNGMVDEFEGAPGSIMLSTPGPQGAANSSGPMTSLTSASTGGVSVEGDVSRGWSPYLTLYSMEKNCNFEGKPRININQADMKKLYDALAAVVPKDWATFIVAYRQNGPFEGTEVTTGQRVTTGDLDFTKAGGTKFTQVLDLIGKKTQITFKGASEATVLESPFADDPIAMALYLPVLMEHLTVSQAAIIPGRININQAPKTILAGIPGMTEAMLSEIISRRDFEPSDDLPNRKFETWILAEGIVNAQEMQLLMPFLTGGGDVHRAQVVGYFEGGGASARAEVVFDATNPKPRVLFWRDLSHLGRGFSLDILGIELAETY